MSKDRCLGGDGPRPGGHQFEIQLGHVCNNRCVFCSSGQLSDRKEASPVPIEAVLEAMSSARSDGARRVTFLGGEPTIHDGFMTALRHAADLGFEEIVVFTNGAMLTKAGFVDEVISVARVEWRVSIQGGNEEAHSAVTRRKGSFQRLMAGLRLLRERRQRLTANLCLCAQNYRSLPDLPDIVVEYGVSQLHLDIIRPSSAGERTEEYLRDIMPRYSKMAPFLARMLERLDLEAPGADVSIGNIPFCVMPQWAHRIRHGGESTITASSDPSGLEGEVDKYAWHASMRRHVPRCEGCDLRPRCGGVFGAYLDLYGEAELTPVSVEDLCAPAPRGTPERVLTDAFGTKLDPRELMEGIESAGLGEGRLICGDEEVVLECPNPDIKEEPVAESLTWLVSRLSPLLPVRVAPPCSRGHDTAGRFVDRRERPRMLVALAELTSPTESLDGVVDDLLERISPRSSLENAAGSDHGRCAPALPEVRDRMRREIALALAKSLRARLPALGHDPASATISILDWTQTGLVVAGEAGEARPASRQAEPRPSSSASGEDLGGGPHFLVWFRPGGEEGVRPAALVAASRRLEALRWLGAALSGRSTPTPGDAEILLDGLAWKVARRPTIAAPPPPVELSPQFPIRTDSGRCSRCERCVSVCPMGCYEAPGRHHPNAAERCTRCYECVEACAADALRPTYARDTSTLASALAHRPGWISRLGGLPGPSFPAPFPPSYLAPRTASPPQGPRYVLGLAIMTMQEHAAVLLKDGEVVGAIEHEKLVRIRHAGWHPPGRPGVTLASDPTLCLEEAFCRRPIRALLEREGITLDDVDLFALNGLHGRHVDRISFTDPGASLPKVHTGRVVYIPHHLCHAASAYRMSGVGDAVILTIDGRGDRECAAVFRARDGKIEMIDTLLSLVDRSIGGVYEGVTRLLGFGSHGQGSVMALASFGSPVYDFDSILAIGDDGRARIHESAVYEQFGHLRRERDAPLTQAHKDLAASLQAALERCALKLVGQAVGDEKIEALCVGGGVALNCRMNERLRREFRPERMFVQPAANDAGTALGAALEAWADLGGAPPSPMVHAYAGPEFDDATIERELLRSGAAYERVDDVASEVAERLARGQVVCWFQGPLEVGPRALGARSIVADPSRDDMHERVNAIKERERWRPFGPSMLAGHEGEWLERAFDARFMLFTLPVREEKRRLIPAVVHVDGTTRPQVVHPETSPLYHRMISAFYARSGVPMVLNTSFNRRGEPIVCTPRDALESFWGLGADALAIGGFIVESGGPSPKAAPLDESLAALPGGRRLSIRVTTRCDFACGHCTIRDLDGMQERSLDELRRRLAAGRAAGCDELVLMRGEASLRPDLPRVVAVARKMGYRFVQLQTNAHGLAAPGVLERLSSAGGIDAFEVTLLAPSEALHDELSGLPGSYRRTLAGLRALVRSGRQVLANVPVLAGNMRHLGGMVALCHKLGVTRLQLAFPRPVELAHEVVTDPVPRLAIAADYVSRAAALAHSKGIAVSAEAFPLCRLPRELWGTPDATEDWSRHRVDDLTALHEAVSDGRHTQRPQPPPCRDCVEQSRCPRTWALYLELFGSGELRPFTE